MRLFIRSSLSIYSLCAAATVSLASTTYAIQDLGSLGSGASGVSTGGVGYYTNASGDQTPSIFSPSGVFSLPGVGIASGRNSSGTIIGTTYSNNLPAVTEWVNGQSRSLGLSGFGNAINDAGQIGGGYLTDASLHAFIETGTSVRDIGGLGGSWGAVMALNASGQAAGTASTSNGAFHSFFWDGYGMNDLGTLGGTNSYGAGINGKGAVVGASQTAAGYLNAYLWHGTGLLDLGTLGGSTSAAYGINDSGEIVGNSLIAGNGATHGFVEVAGVMVDLNSLLPVGSDWTITGAYAVDNSGDILGTGSEGGKQFAVELSPSQLAGGASTVGAPEPGATALAGVGFLIVASLGKRKRAGATGPSS